MEGLVIDPAFGGFDSIILARNSESLGASASEAAEVRCGRSKEFSGFSRARKGTGFKPRRIDGGGIDNWFGVGWCLSSVGGGAAASILGRASIAGGFLGLALA